MTGDFYSNMPDTTSPLSPYRRAIRRLVASMLLFTSSLLLVVSMGFAQVVPSDDDFIGDDVTCEQFDTPEDAELYLQENPDAEIILDSDGNGVVCDEDPDLFTDDFDNGDDFSDDAQYEEDFDAPVNQTQQPQQTPPTGGVALLPLAGSVLSAGFGGFMLLRRR